jgi:hypothetical protein
MANQEQSHRELYLRFALGLAEGFVAGVATCLALQRLATHKRQSSVTVPERRRMRAQASLQGAPAGSNFRDYRTDIPLKRESGETAGDPGDLLSISALQAKTDFSHATGAPGSKESAEVLERPGLPGQALTHTDAAQPVKPAGRSLKIS